MEAARRVSATASRLAGTRSFHAKDITWSIRKRGSVQRIHMITMITTLTFIRNHIQPAEKGLPQPPKKSATAKAATKNKCANSARKKNANRIPEYPVK